MTVVIIHTETIVQHVPSCEEVLEYTFSRETQPQCIWMKFQELQSVQFLGFTVTKQMTDGHCIFGNIFFTE